jgi:hypothetical protein
LTSIEWRQHSPSSPTSSRPCDVNMAFSSRIAVRYRRESIAGESKDRHPRPLEVAPHPDRLPDGHPLKTFVCFLALYAREVRTGQLPGDPWHYQSAPGERYAREAPIPDAHAAVEPRPRPAVDARCPKPPGRFVREAPRGTSDRLREMRALPPLSASGDASRERRCSNSQRRDSPRVARVVPGHRAEDHHVAGFVGLSERTEVGCSLGQTSPALRVVGRRKDWLCALAGSLDNALVEAVCVLQRACWARGSRSKTRGHWRESAFATAPTAATSASTC